MKTGKKGSRNFLKKGKHINLLKLPKFTEDEICTEDY